jgi:hypothetical protein
MPVGHRAEHQRRNERRDRGGGEGERLDAVQPVRVENRAERHEPDGHGRRLDEKQNHQLGVFGFAQRP